MSNRATIFNETAKIISHQQYDGDQFVLRLAAPLTAKHAIPGHFVHITSNPLLPMKRPISIMRADADEGWIDLLYKVLGQGTQLLSERVKGEELELLGPIGKGFNIDSKRPLLIGGGVGMPPMIFIAEQFKNKSANIPFVILGSEVPFPFKAVPSKIMVPGMPAEVIGAMPLLDDWNIPSRLTSLQNYPGTFQGYVTELADLWLKSLSEEQLSEVCIYSCGPNIMLEAVVNLARQYKVPVQVSLEEYMACAVGGCAGCVVEVKDDQGGAYMKRVCVDGPVFDGYSIY